MKIKERDDKLKELRRLMEVADENDIDVTLSGDDLENLDQTIKQIKDFLTAQGIELNVSESEETERDTSESVQV